MKNFILLMFMATLINNIQAQETKPIIIGHRGAMGYELENTIPSIKKALELNVDMIEIDVYKIATGEIVVFHDDTVDRLSNSTGSIEDFSFTVLREIALKDSLQIPTLEEVINTIDKKCKLNIELKGANTATDTYRIIQDCIQLKNWEKSDFIISSFRWDELEKMRSLDENIAIAILLEGDPLEGIVIAQELKAIAINPAFKNLTSENVAKIKSLHFKIFPWTVNSLENIHAMINFKVDGIITNYPDRVAEALK
ncbi:glycerophosphoryl diester phosphodiesterase [Pustulibacterium marinum]|uniref:Glycerophosphoryl diester phosphodiesterase n=1 Tax=Pustulibacterium marinum TaxID=1224947 RepID=A0A1I7EUR2_9FLAO|nr:glycerophosphodiester phosphodiesterase family protein [Pustulibacterium marinum]SFU27661.1 glycerophosphoryl diester phosphodiesterase [Pustulibacterium marinum]